MRGSERPAKPLRHQIMVSSSGAISRRPGVVLCRPFLRLFAAFARSSDAGSPLPLPAREQTLRVGLGHRRIER
ncbi:MAG: hypothetical protein ACREH9_06780, partial [Pseudomonadota bacterium]